jgi:hypothetical protein
MDSNLSRNVGPGFDGPDIHRKVEASCKGDRKFSPALSTLCDDLAAPFGLTVDWEFFPWNNAPNLHRDSSRSSTIPGRLRELVERDPHPCGDFKLLDRIPNSFVERLQTGMRAAIPGGRLKTLSPNSSPKI